MTLTEEVRAFNRFYTREIGLLNRRLPGGDLTLPEARVLYEIAHAPDPGCTAADIGRELRMDRGRLSRIVARFRGLGLVGSRADPQHGKRLLITLTGAGHRAFAALDAGARAQIDRLLSPIEAAEREKLASALRAVRAVLERGEGADGNARLEHAGLRSTPSSVLASPPPLRGRNKEGGGAALDRYLRAADANVRSQCDPPPLPAPARGAGAPAGAGSTQWEIALRPFGLGDLGWIAHRQALLYHQEYGWDWTYEGLACQILGAFASSFDPAREAGWIADKDGAILGSVFLMKTDDPALAKLRLLYVEPSARGSGLGRTLVEACIARARALGYRRLTLWTNDVLVAARRIYETCGFTLIEAAPHHSFGCDLIGQTWVLELAPDSAG